MPGHISAPQGTDHISYLGVQSVRVGAQHDQLFQGGAKAGRLSNTKEIRGVMGTISAWHWPLGLTSSAFKDT